MASRCRLGQGKAWEALAGMSSRGLGLWFMVSVWFGGCGDGGTQLNLGNYY